MSARPDDFALRPPSSKIEVHDAATGEFRELLSLEELPEGAPLSTGPQARPLCLSATLGMFRNTQAPWAVGPWQWGALRRGPWAVGLLAQRATLRLSAAAVLRMRPC